jgi:hypothetical protein
MSRVDFDDTAARDEKLSRGARRWQKKELQGYQSKRPPHSAAEPMGTETKVWQRFIK